MGKGAWGGCAIHSMSTHNATNTIFEILHVNLYILVLFGYHVSNFVGQKDTLAPVYFIGGLPPITPSEIDAYALVYGHWVTTAWHDVTSALNHDQNKTKQYIHHHTSSDRPVTLNNASDYQANGLLLDYIGWTNGLSD